MAIRPYNWGFSGSGPQLRPLSMMIWQPARNDGRGVVGGMSHTWVRFSLAGESPSASRIVHYRIDEVRHVKGRALELPVGARLTRSDTSELLNQSPEDLIGVVQHVGYTDADRKRALAAESAAESGPRAVLIPIAKVAAWWTLAQDERLALLRASGHAQGHFDIGARYASRIYRRLLHCRYLPHSRWDFLTYFEFPEAHAPTFRELLEELRDIERNPEWSYVEHETEVWLTKLDGSSLLGANETP